jgi:putative Mg2+ transporter-C (MgtC) family protein
VERPFPGEEIANVPYYSFRKGGAVTGTQLVPWINLEIIIRLVAAGVTGGIIGWERQARAKPAGLRTHSLVGLGSGLLTALSLYAFTPGGDISRVAASVVIGIGFIGAGMIMVQEHRVLGLTSAATIWVVAAVGIAFGAGYYLPALAATVFTFILLRLPW